MSAWSRFAAWAEQRVPGDDLRRLRIGFALVWLAYDALDLALGGTARGWVVSPATLPSGLRSIQLGLVAAEAAMLTERGAAIGTLAATGLRAFEASIFPLNDFLYFIVTALLLAHARAPGGPPYAAPRWTVAALYAQVTWIYLATATLKLSPDFLSGGHFWVRHQWLAMTGHTYPALYARCAESLPCNAFLAWSAVASELALGLLLLVRAPAWIVGALALGIHGFAALTNNVTFFGASMVIHVYFVARAAACYQPAPEA